MLREYLNAFEDGDEVLLAEEIYVIVDDQLEAFETMLDDLLLELLCLNGRCWGGHLPRRSTATIGVVCVIWEFRARGADLAGAADVEDDHFPSIVLHVLPAELDHLLDGLERHQLVCHIRRHHDVRQRLQDRRLPLCARPLLRLCRLIFFAHIVSHLPKELFVLVFLVLPLPVHQGLCVLLVGGILHGDGRLLPLDGAGLLARREVRAQVLDLDRWLRPRRAVEGGSMRWLWTWLRLGQGGAEGLALLFLRLLELEEGLDEGLDGLYRQLFEGLVLWRVTLLEDAHDADELVPEQLDAPEVEEEQLHEALQEADRDAVGGQFAALRLALGHGRSLLVA